MVAKILRDIPPHNVIPLVLGDRRDKAKTLPRDCLYELSAVTRLPQGLPQHPDVLGKICFLHEAIRPQGCHQLFLFDEVTGSRDEQD
jgi:hypothetical protein